jgi:hypothetical protein
MYRTTETVSELGAAGGGRGRVHHGHGLCMPCVASAALPLGTSGNGSNQTRGGTFCRFAALGVMAVQ